MKTLRRYIIREIFYATLLVFVALLLLFAFFDLLEELRKLGQGSYGIKEAALFVVLSAPNHVYELFPIAALIGTLFALSQLVASSEYAVMRSAGVSISDLVGVIASIGLLFGAIAFVTGEFCSAICGATCATTTFTSDDWGCCPRVSLWFMDQRWHHLCQRADRLT